MRPKTEKRFAATALTLLAAFTLTSCDNKPKAKGTGTGSESTPVGLAIVVGPSARQAADAFLKSLSEGKASPEQFTAWFKKQTSKPIAEMDPEDWLEGFKGVNFVVGEETKFGNSIVLRGRAESSSQKDSFSLRLTKEGGTYKVDWLHRSARQGSGITTPADADLAAAQDTARNFLDLLLGGNIRQAQALMTNEWKTSVGEPGFLTQAMRSWKGWDGDVVGYTFAKTDLNGKKDAATFVVEMDTGTKKTPHTVKAKNVNGQWLLEAFEK